MSTNYMSYRRKSVLLNNSQDFLYGIRAILAVQSFAWLFFKVFNPALTVPGPNESPQHVPAGVPTTVPGVVGGPGIVARDLTARNLSMLISLPPKHSCHELVKRRVVRQAGGLVHGGRQKAFRNMSATRDDCCLEMQQQMSCNSKRRHVQMRYLTVKFRRQLLWTQTRKSALTSAMPAQRAPTSDLYSSCFASVLTMS